MNGNVSLIGNISLHGLSFQNMGPAMTILQDFLGQVLILSIKKGLLLGLELSRGGWKLPQPIHISLVCL